MAIAPYLSIVGVFIYLGGFVVYNLPLLRGRAFPAPSRTTWTMWAVLSVMYAWSYGVMSHDWWKSLQPYGGVFANIGTCVIVWRSGGTRDFNRRNWVIISVSIFAILAWWLTRNATWGNSLLFLAIAISLIPTIRNVARNPRAEKPLPWLMFALSYLVQTSVVILRYEQSQDLGAPIGGAILHLLVGLLALRRPQPKPPR